MDKNRKTAFNTHLILFLALFVIFIGMAIFFLIEDFDIINSIVSFAIAAVVIFVIAISPVIYIFDDESLTIVYFLGVKERIAWKEIRSITRVGTWTHESRIPVYEIAYPCHKKYPFFVNSEVARNRKTKKLIEERYNKKIEE